MSGVRDRLGRLPLRRHGILGAIVGLSVLVAISVAAPAAGAAKQGAQSAKQTRALWTGVAGTPRPARTGARPAIRPDRFRSFRLDRAGLRIALARAGSGLVVSLPAPGGGFQRFALELSPVMEPALARKHPGIKTFAGRGLDDPTATIRADIGPLGFHASVRSSKGSWYIDPYYRNDQSLYVSYYGRNLDNVHGTFVEREGDEAEAEAFAAELAEALDVPEGPLVTLRTYRLALLSDPTLRHLLRRPCQRDGRQGHARQPRQPDLRGRDGGPHDPRGQQRPHQPRHARADDGRERPVRLRAVLHAGPGDLVRRRDADPHPDRHRADHRRVELRRRPHRPREPRRRRGEPRRRRREQQGAGLHRALDAGRRLLRRRLRGARDRPPVRRQPHVQRHAVELLRREPQRGQLGRARERLVDHGLRRHLPAGQPPAAQRPVLVVPQLPGDHGARDRRQAADQRGAERLADGLLRRQRDADVPAHRLRRHRLVPARVPGQPVGADRERDELQRGRHPGGHRGHRRVPGGRRGRGHGDRRHRRADDGRVRRRLRRHRSPTPTSPRSPSSTASAPPASSRRRSTAGRPSTPSRSATRARRPSRS